MSRNMTNSSAGLWNCGNHAKGRQDDGDGRDELHCEWRVFLKDRILDTE